jgi:hemolysin D
MTRTAAAGARLALLSRYRETFVQAWRERKSAAAFLTVDEAEFSPPALALTQRPVSPTARTTAALLMGLVAVLIAWAGLGQIDIVAYAVGQVIPSARTKTIESVQTAVVRTIYAGEGQSVRAGQVLVALDAKPLEADYRKAVAQERAAELEMARSRALIAGTLSHRPPRLPAVSRVSLRQLQEAQRHLTSQYLAFATKLTELQGDVDQYARALPVIRQREEIYAGLLTTHDVSRDAWLTKEQERIDLEGQLADAQNARAVFIAQTRRTAYESYTQAAEAAKAAEQEALRAASQVAWLTLRSPVDGTVQQLTVHTVGGVVAAAEPLMVIVPEDEQLEVQAYLQNKDVGFIKLGQPAQVKVIAFDYTRYGTIRGRVVSISRDAVESSAEPASSAGGQEKGSAFPQNPRYLVRIALARSAMNVDGDTKPLLPGMAVTVEIKTGKRRVIDYFLSPLLRQGSESLHER